MALTPAEKQSISKRNFPLMILEGVLFWSGLAFVEPNTVVSVFITEMTGSMQLAGLAATFRLLAMYAGQFLMGVYVYRVTDKGEWMKKYGFWTRMSYWVIVPPLLLGFTGASVAWVFIFAYTAFFFLDGIVGLCWIEISAHTITPQNRGAMHGFQQFFSSLMGLGSAFVIKLLMDGDLPPNLRYACIFGLCALVFTINGLTLRTLKDIPRDLTVPPRRSFSRYIGQFGPLWKANPLFRSIVGARILYSAGTMAAALLVLFGRSTGGLTNAQVSSMIFMQVLGQLSGGLLWGLISRKLGNVWVMRGGISLATVIGGIGVYMFFAGGMLFLPCAIMVFLSGVQSYAYTGFSNTVIDTMPYDHLSAYIVLQSVILMPLALTPYLASFLAETFSFLPVFILLIAFGLYGIFQIERVKRLLPEIPRDRLPEE